MNRHVRFLFLISILVSIAGCSVRPQPITYGKDGCHFCRMTIVDRQHATQLVTKKGKVFNFDAMECMINYTKEIDTNKVELYLCNHYTAPEELIDATKATFLISEGIPSPMGAFLTAFDTEESAIKAKEEHGGVLYTWKELLDHFYK